MSNGQPHRDEGGSSGQWKFNEAALRAEILFWRELIETSGPEQPHENVERMRQALSLAELKLRKTREVHGPGVNAIPGNTDDESTPMRVGNPPAAE